MSRDSLELLRIASQVLFEKKGSNILALDVRGLSTLTDFFLIAEGGVERHVMALGHEVMRVMKEEGASLMQAEGMSEGDWVVLDYGDIVVHLFTPKMRDKYRLEEFWREGELIPLDEKRAVR